MVKFHVSLRQYDIRTCRVPSTVHEIDAEILGAPVSARVVPANHDLELQRRSHSGCGPHRNMLTVPKLLDRKCTLDLSVD